MSESRAPSRVGHPLALWAFRQLQPLPDVDRRAVFEELSERVGGQSDERLGAIRDALVACASELGATIPSAAQYEAWRVSSPTGVGAPTTSQLRRICGSWSQALRAVFAAPEADPTRRRLLAPRPLFTEGQALLAAKMFLAALPPDEPPAFARYREWASVHRDGDGRATVPCNEKVFRRFFGSWSATLIKAGADPSRLHLRSRPRTRRFTQDDCVVALRAAHAELGEPLGRARYDQWVRERDRRCVSESDADLAPAPIANTVCKFLGGWRRAQIAVLGADVLLSRASRPDDYTENELVEMWRACAHDVGHPPSAQEYDSWRLSRMRHGDGSNSAPHSNSLARRIGNGSWNGVAMALGETLPRARRRRAYTATELEDAYRACLTQIGHVPSQSEYEQWRESRLSRDPMTLVPFSWTLVRRIGHGSWAVIAEIVCGHTGNHPKRPPVYTEAELVAAWRACRDARGRPPRQEEYDGWRHSRMRDDPQRPVPLSRTLVKRLGGGRWRGVESLLESENGVGHGFF